MEQMHIILKRLRKEKGLSQEELGELLGVSGAAVSKWENAVTMPDMTQIVPLTRIFGVTADTLFGLRAESDEEETNRLLGELYALEDVYPPEEGIHIVDAYREAIRNYPGNVAILSEALAFSAALVLYYAVLPPEEAERVTRDCHQWAERIFRYADREETITSAKNTLIQLYCRQKKFDEAIAIANGLQASVSRTRDIVMAGIFWQAGRFAEEKELHARNIETLLRALHTEVMMLGNRYRHEENDVDAVVCYDAARKLLDAVYGEELYRPPFQKQTAEFRYPAQSLLRMGNVDGALDWLEAFAAAYLAERADFNRQETVASPLLRGQTYRFGYDGNASFEEYYRRVLEDPCFDGIRENERFRAIAARLQA